MKDWRSLHDACWSEDRGNAQGVCDLPATAGGGTRALPILFFRIQRFPLEELDGFPAGERSQLWGNLQLGWGKVFGGGLS